LTEHPPVFELSPVGRVRNDRHDRSALPHQGRGRDVRSVIELKPRFEPAAREIRPGDLYWVLTWLHLADRDLLRAHPRGDKSRPERGVFSLRSPGRPNPIGLSLVEVTAVSGLRLDVRGLEVLDGTPVLDIKPYVPEADR